MKFFNKTVNTDKASAGAEDPDDPTSRMETRSWSQGWSASMIGRIRRGRPSASASTPADEYVSAPDHLDDAGNESAPAKTGGFAGGLTSKALGVFQGKRRRDNLGSSSTTSVAAGIGASSNLALSQSVLSFGKKPAAIGLTWMSAGASDSLKELAEMAEGSAISSQLESTAALDVFADLRENGFVGFGSSDHDVRKGMPALATAIPADLAGPRWIGIFNIGSGSDIWWLGAMRNGQVSEDRIIRGRASAEEAFFTELEAPDWTAVFAPEGWGVSGSISREIWEVVDLKGASRMRYLKPLKAYLPRLILGVVAAAIAVGAIYWYNDMRARELAELEALRRQMEEQIHLAPRDHPWHEVTRVSDFIEACEGEIEETVMLIPGWESQPVSCRIEGGGKGRITTGWSNSGGRFSMLRAALPADVPEPVLSRDGQSASFSRSFDAPFEEDSFSDEPWDERRIENWLRERFQSYGLDISLRASQGNKPVAAARPVFNSTDIKVNSRFGMRNFGDMFQDVPALTPSVMIYNIETNTWEMVLKAYHPVIMPTPKR